MAVLGVGFGVFVAGLILTVRFLSKYGQDLAFAPRMTSRPSIYLKGFVVYLVSFCLLQLITAVVSDVVAPGRLEENTLLMLGAGLVAMVAAISLGLTTFRGLAAREGEDWRRIGLALRSAGTEVVWGVCGYFAVLPTVFAAAIISYTVFRDIPQHPLLRTVAGGGQIVFVAALLMASVAAPLVEETAFRGLLYPAFRGKMGVWPAACASAAIFAVISPVASGWVPADITCWAWCLHLCEKEWFAAAIDDNPLPVQLWEPGDVVAADLTRIIH